MAPITISLQNIRKLITLINIDDSVTVFELKNALGAQLSLPADRLSFLFKNKLLSNDKILFDEGM